MPRTVNATLETGAVMETVSIRAEAGDTVNSTSGEIARVLMPNRWQTWR